MGVYVFPAGCENFGSGRREQSKRTSRRLLRLRRIRYTRIRARKFYLLREMAKHNMCPISQEELSHWKQHKEFPSSTLSSWLAMNPYALRAKGLTEKLSRRTGPDILSNFKASCVSLWGMQFKIS